MANIQPIRPELHLHKRWMRCTDYKFAAKDSYCSLTAHELPRAMMAFPIAFVCTDDKYIPVSIQGLEPSTNLLIDPDGRWTTAYVPAHYRSYPFLIANDSEGQKFVCFDEDSELLTDDSSAELFFDEDEKPSSVLLEIMDFLNKLVELRDATANVCQILQEKGLFKPWPITVSKNDTKQIVEGLYAIDEEKLNALSNEEFIELRECGGLLVCYCQLLSMQNINKLLLLANTATQASEVPENLSFDSEYQSDTLNFDNL